MTETVSNTPWSNFKDSDYSDEQYAKSCILDRGPDVSTAKQRYSLRVREPNGTLNRNGVHAAASVLAGGRGGVNASSDAKVTAIKKLVTLYGTLNEKPPPSLIQHSDAGEDILKHFGIKGMRWGIRRDNPGATTSGGGSHVGNVTNLVSEDHARAAAVTSKIRTGGTKTVSNKELQDVITRMNLEQQYSRLHSQKTSTLESGHARVKKILGFANTAKQIHEFVNSPLGKAVKLAMAAKKPGG